MGWKGRAIIIPGRSYTGKSTLVAEFLRAGATYYSDEFAVFDRHGCVHPFSRPLGLRLDATGKQTKRCAHELGGKVGTKPIPVGLVIVTKYKKQGTWRPQPISAGRAVLALLANSISARNDPERALGILAQAYEGARALHGARGEASEVVRMVQATLQSPGS